MMKKSKRSDVDPFIVMDVMESARIAEEKGKDIINKSGLNVIAADNLSDAAKKIVSAVKGN